jgi:hypothetical protein
VRFEDRPASYLHERQYFLDTRRTFFEAEVYSYGNSFIGQNWCCERGLNSRPLSCNFSQAEASFVLEAGGVPLACGLSPDDVAEAIALFGHEEQCDGAQMIAVGASLHLAWKPPDVVLYACLLKTTQVCDYNYNSLHF